MSERFRPTFPILILMTIWFLSSCSDTPEVLHILTDRRELASAVEIYDSNHEDLIVTMRHVPFVDESLIESEDPDIVIASNLYSPEITGTLKNLDLEYSGYNAISDLSGKESKTVLIPLSFKLPLIMGLKTTMATLPDSSTIRPEELRESAAELRKVDKEGRLTALGFSPSWDDESFVDLWIARDPSALEDGMENLDEEELQAVVAEAGRWILDAAGGTEADKAFDAKYRYIPDERLLEDNRILFARTDMEYWATLPDSVSRNLDIRYFRGERSIPVLSVVSAGIPRRSGRSKAAEEFILWLTERETQKQLMNRWERDGITVFGYFGGLSADPEVNQSILLERYPSMIGMIPEGHYLDGPQILPHRWKRIREEVVGPWFAEAAAREAEPLNNEATSPGPSLNEAYTTWDLSSLTETD